MKKRVVITGLGAITPVGNDTDTFWNNIKNGVCGIDFIKAFDAENYKAKVAAEVKGFDPHEHLDRKESKRFDRFCQFAMVSAMEAVKDSKLDIESVEKERFGVVIGSGIGGIETIEKQHSVLEEKGPNKITPLFIPMIISNMAAGNVAIKFGAKGPCSNIVTACATGTNCVGEAFRMIKNDLADVMIAGGTEAAITPLGIAGFSSLTALTSAIDPTRASIPFDKERSGFVMGEGAGVVVLESYEHAVARGANILGELVGYGATCDAYHITSPSEDGDGAARAMLFAINEAGIKPEDVDYVNAHGTSTHHNDLFETRAIKKAFGDHAYRLNVNSTKSMTGHLLGAAGAVEFITCIKSVMENYIHATVGYQIPDEELDLNYTVLVDITEAY